MSRVFITDTKYKMALAPIRLLSKAGHDVVCCEYEETPSRLCLGFLSKYASEKKRVPSDGGALLNSLEAACRPGDVVLPVGRSTLRALSQRRTDAQNAAFLVSSPETLDNADDKAFIHDTAKRLGIPVPETKFLSQYSSVEALADSVSYPCIIKYRDGEALGFSSHERYFIARNREIFAREYARMEGISKNPLAQNYLTGSDIGVAVVMDREHRPVDFICYESLLEYPVSGGPTCLCRTIFNRQLLKNACAVLREINFTGIAMLDFKGTPDNAHLLEINPRVWGSAGICAVSDASFFDSYVKAALGLSEPIDPDSCQPNYRLGAKMRFFPQNIAAYIQKLKNGNFTSAISGCIKDIFDPSVRDGLFLFGDSKPFFRYIKNSR